MSGGSEFPREWARTVLRVLRTNVERRGLQTRDATPNTMESDIGFFYVGRHPEKHLVGFTDGVFVGITDGQVEWGGSATFSAQDTRGVLDAILADVNAKARTVGVCDQVHEGPCKSKGPRRRLAP